MNYHLHKELEKDARILAKCINDPVYAQNLYAAICNNVFYKINDVGEFVSDEYWSASWRAAGGIVADIRNIGEDYMDFYCSGLASEDGFVQEGTVTVEIREDLASINWVVRPYEDNSENDKEGV